VNLNIASFTIKDRKVILSTLWIVVMFNMVFADIYSIMVELVNKNTLGDIPGDVITVMAIAAIITNIPIIMIFLSRVLDYKINRLMNIIAGIFTILYVVGGGSITLHYIIISTIEVILLLTIIWIAWKWPKSQSDRSSSSYPQSKSRDQ
jgi:hypothetical protein